MKTCMKCGGSAKRKMATGGSTTNKLNKPKTPVKPQTGGSNTKMGIYGIPSAGPTGNNLSGTYSYKKGGATTAVKASCKKGMVRSATGGCVAERPKFAKGGFPDLNNDNKITKADILKGRGVIKKIGGSVKKYQNGGAAKTTLSKAPSKMKSGLTSKDPMTSKDISKFVKSGKKYQNGGSMFTPAPKRKMTVNTNPIKKSRYTTPTRKVPMAQNGGQNKPTVQDKDLFPGSQIAAFLGAGAATALAARRQNKPEVQQKQKERIIAREQKRARKKQ